MSEAPSVQPIFSCSDEGNDGPILAELPLEGECSLMSIQLSQERQLDEGLWGVVRRFAAPDYSRSCDLLWYSSLLTSWLVMPPSTKRFAPVT